MACFLVAAPTLAWDPTGHEVVARLAWRQLSDEVRTEATTLLRAAPPATGIPQLEPDFGTPQLRERVLFERASLWSDLVRGDDRFDRPSWHYVNRYWERASPSSRPRDRVDLPTRTPNVVSELERLTDRLGDPGLSPGERAVDLAWILHLVGDVHQPLHTSARVTPEHPSGDRGGNEFPLPDAPQRDLHGLWDSILEVANPQRHDENRGEYLERLADGIEALFPPSSLSRAIDELDPDAWAREGYVLSRDELYPPTLQAGHPAPEGYADRAYELALPRIALAGYRLGALLEERFATGP
jgi:hypothetical protein